MPALIADFPDYHRLMLCVGFWGIQNQRDPFLTCLAARTHPFMALPTMLLGYNIPQYILFYA